MATQFICDVCGEVIKNIMYIIAVVKEEIQSEETNTQDLNSVIKYNRYIQNNSKTNMLCEKCHGVWQYLLNMRVEELEKAKKDFIGYMKSQIHFKPKLRDQDIYDQASELIMKLPKMVESSTLPNIYFVGKAGAGKSYSARFLIEKYGFKVAKFAYPVYMIAEKYFGMKEKDRKLLQIIGTDAGRDIIDKNIWVKRFKQDMKIIQTTAKILKKQMPKYVMDDCRFPNEHKILQELGFVGIYIDVPDDIRKGRLIVRDGTAQENTLNHKSETLIDKFKDDLIKLDGHGDLKNTYYNLNNLLFQLGN